ncbi:MAG: AAA family ATPase, partial [Bacteroidales bacterium]|nr:AAA family ATPase [Bacteroidales bacterium]
SIHDFLYNGNSVALIGTGGAAKAAVVALERLGVQITVFGRSVTKLNYFKENFECEILDISLLDKYLKNYRVIVSTLPAGTDVFTGIKLQPFHIVLDANYKSSALEHMAKEYGAKFISGKTWLGQQAKPAFKLVSGIKPSLKVIMKAVDCASSVDVERIILTGFMGVGKSTIGKVLAEKLNYQFADTDQIIQEQESMSINEIFNQKGEAYFRTKEAIVLKNLLQNKDIVISCGGGITELKQNKNLIREKSLNFWLDASLEYCLKYADVEHRPKLQKCSSNEIMWLYENRKSNYFQTAHVLLNTENKSIQQISEQIYEEVIAVRNV